MKYIKTKLLILSLYVSGLTGLRAQEALTATGDYASGQGGSVSYSVGQLVYHELTGTGGKINEGVQQPFEITAILGIENEGISLVCSVFPNPAKLFVTLKIENLQLDNLIYQLFDLNGKLLENRKIEYHETPIGLGGFDSAVYLLKVTDNRKELKTFLIIKN
ncbi:MAG TPA: T9SS type A sorting domain-containing protein [Cyclobacteriaceae bacterium]|nr:T9SS type A sorting domain-containing protein [Cyclobacteriaceae bacterium]